MIKYLHDNNLLTGLIWEPVDTAHQSKTYQQWLSKLRKTQSQLIYTTSNGGLLKGYSERKFADLEPFAIFVKNEFGDGIYYIRGSEEDDEVYFLIITDDRILSGSDKIVRSCFFDKLILQMKESEYSHLQINELNREWINDIAMKCNQRRIKTRKKKRLFLSGVVLAGVFILIIVIFLLHTLPE